MSFFRYPGGKNKLKDNIITKLSIKKGLQYREPFFGGGSIGLQLLSDELIDDIWINDKDVGISCLWTSVILFHEELKERIQNFTPSINNFYTIKDELLKLDFMPKNIFSCIDIGFKKLAIHQISYSGLGVKSGGPLGGVKQKSKYKINCRWSPKYLCRKIDYYNSKFKNARMSRGFCSNLDFQTIIEDDCPAILYIDPPYFHKGNELYQCGFTIQDHVRLCRLLMKSKHHWVLSYDDCLAIRKMYDWANIEIISTNYTIKQRKNNNVKTELLIYSKE